MRTTLPSCQPMTRENVKSLSYLPSCFYPTTLSRSFGTMSGQPFFPRHLPSSSLLPSSLVCKWQIVPHALFERRIPYTRGEKVTHDRHFFLPLPPHFNSKKFIRFFESQGKTARRCNFFFEARFSYYGGKIARQSCGIIVHAKLLSP